MDDDRLTRGFLTLEAPMPRDEGEDIERINYDFSQVTGALLLNALGNGAPGQLNARQALELFVCACAPEDNGGLTRAEIKTRLSAGDMLAAQALGAGFFRTRLASALTRIGAR